MRAARSTGGTGSPSSHRHRCRRFPAPRAFCFFPPPHFFSSRSSPSHKTIRRPSGRCASAVCPPKARVDNIREDIHGTTVADPIVGWKIKPARKPAPGSMPRINALNSPWTACHSAPRCKSASAN